MAVELDSGFGDLKGLFITLFAIRSARLPIEKKKHAYAAW